METIGNAIDKRFNKSLVAFIKLADPERKYCIDALLMKTWDDLHLVDQRKLYLYLLYRKWRGIDIYGEPYYIIRNCHPVPFNWNGVAGVNALMKQGKMVIAKHNGSYGTYTKDEAMLYQMTDIKPLC